MTLRLNRLALSSKCLDLARWSDWSASKLPFLGAAALLLAPAETSSVKILALFATICCWAAFGYCINDVADRECDLRAGKTNRANDIARAYWVLFLSLSAASSLWLSLLWAADLAGPLVILCGLLLACAYSLPPFRLKECGAVGLIAGAACQWVAPVFAAATVQVNGWYRPATFYFALLGLAIGIRWIAIHQLQDRAADRRAGVCTYASGGGRMLPILVGAFAAEIILLTATLAVTWPHSVPAVAALVFWITEQWLLRPRGEPLRQKLQGYSRAPLAEYYFFLLPLALALARAISSPAFLVIAAVFVALGWCYLQMMTGDWYDGWKEKGGRSL